VRIALGCDHRGITLKQAVMSLLGDLGYDYEDFGCYDTAPVDYPDIARKVASGVADGNFEHGILVCSTGIGMSIAANKVCGVRAALCRDTLSARRAREHNDANVLCLGEDVMSRDLALEVARAYLDSRFEGGRHQRRLEKIRTIEEADYGSAGKN
jgi:ribose 5-phosphate isomerase B